ncbi:MAG TPA: nucleoside-diphosphate sugar epimerase/dehydratase [Ohtaekwangia sp.]|nr:nucleoside-diphosphate sugar epimerase/dehydratase [Ohtaekwangia sp.]
MNRYLRSMQSLKLLPRWVIILIDLSFIAFSAFLGYCLRFNFNVQDIIDIHFLQGIALYTISGLFSIVLTSSYKGIIRYTGVQDGVRIFYMLILNVALVTIFNFLYSFQSVPNLIPYSVILISFLASFLFLFNYRLLVKYMFSFYKRAILKRGNVLIYGAGQTGIITKHVIESSQSSRVVGFLEDDRNKVGKVLNGSRIYSIRENDLEIMLDNFNVDELIITIKNLSPEVKNDIVDVCLRNQVKVRIVPPADKWVKGELSLNQIKEINIDDLLERETIKMDDLNLQKQLFGKRICITGAAGSIGSELVRQVMQYKPDSVILIDQNESALFEIDREVKSDDNGTVVIPYIADITNLERMQRIFGENKPNLVFHAAAYKHVPMMERNSSEAIVCNILGTKLLADLAVEHGVEKFVMISTDKAVNPTSVMGCSKRIAEIYVQSLNNHLDKSGAPHTAFVTTRFGNVLGSNGSVIPVFKKQIEQGGPVTVTHPEITRYFMTIPEACRLVLEAGAMGRGGEIFIFDMGKSVKIFDLARKMIQLSGFMPGKDIDIVFTGLREGEKLYEELLNQKENTLKTHHQKIMIAKVQEHGYLEMNKYIELFNDLVNDRNELKMVALMKELVPEFRSNYSRYEVLDQV